MKGFYLTVRGEACEDCLVATAVFTANARKAPWLMAEKHCPNCARTTTLAATGEEAQ